MSSAGWPWYGRARVLGTLLVLWLMRPSIAVEGSTACPSAADVQGRLVDLMASIPDDVPQDRAVIDRLPDGLHIDLRRDDGGRIAERVLTAAGSCSDLASATAVIVATWEAQLRGQRVARVELDRSSARSGASMFEVGLGGVGSLAFGDAVEPALGGLIFGTWSPKPTGLGLSLTGAATSARSSTLTTPVTTSWSRAFAALGPVYRIVAGPARLDATAGVLVGALSVSAAGVPMASSKTTSDVGTTLGARLSTRWNPMAPWLGIQVLFWPSADHVGVTGPDGRAILRELPRVEAWLTLGVSFGAAS